MKDLKDFVQRVRVVLSQIPIGQRPDDRLTGEWLFRRVKHIRKLERVIEDIRDARGILVGVSGVIFGIRSKIC